MARVYGTKDVQRALDGVTERMAKNVISSGTQALATEVKKVAKRRATAHGGGIARIGRAYIVKKMRGKNKRQVGLRKPFSSLLHLFEFGTQERVQKKTGRRTGRMIPQPTLRPAIEEVYGRAEAIFAKASIRRFHREIRKLEVRRAR